jgi:hypothetical protein
MIFSDFMRKEIDTYSHAYATEKVLIHGSSNLDKKKGGVILFIHFGSFFLSGLSLINKVGIRYTAIASRRNFLLMDVEEKRRWEKTHDVINKLYSRKLFLTDHNSSKEIIKFIKEGGFLGAAIDVAEHGQLHKFEPFEFLQNSIYLQTSPARIAKISNVPLYGMTIVYDEKKAIHDLYLTGPFDANDFIASTQMILKKMEIHVRDKTNQLFHDIFRLFSKRAIAKNLIKSKSVKHSNAIELKPLQNVACKSPTSFSPRYESHITAWHPHREYAYNLVESLQPRLVVELGVHYGDSYFTFCQACEELELETQLYGIDHWQGDKQAGLYGEEVFEEVSSYNEEFYSGKSTLLRMEFEEALPQFEDRSIDLLHIDGSHEYESVKKDFESWLPKLKKGGRILIHDILVEREDFGVKKFWEEASLKYNSEIQEEAFGLGIVNC